MRTGLPGAKHCSLVERNVWRKVVFSAHGHRITHFRCDFFEKRRLSNVGALKVCVTILSIRTLSMAPLVSVLTLQTLRSKFEFSFVASIHFH